jgi:peptidoglycan-associated lipoprotein
MNIKRFWILIISFSMIATLVGCGSYSSLEKADKAYELYQFKIAVDQYKGVLSKVKDRKQKMQITFKIAECYRNMDDYSKAEQYYTRAIKMKYPDPYAYFLKGEMLKKQEKYEEAIYEFKTFVKEAPGDTSGPIALKATEDAIKWKEEKTRYVVENEKILNTKFNDFAPMFYLKGSIVLTSDRDEVKNDKIYGWTGLRFTDIFVANTVKEKTKGKTTLKLEKPVVFEEQNIINTNFNDGVVTFDKKFNTMYYTQCNDPKGKSFNCKIYVTHRKKGNEWEDPQVLPFCTDTFFKYGQPSLSPDEKRLYFSSTMDGGFGKHDLYMSSFVKRGKTWGDPVNLGPTINTTGDDMFPFIYSDNKTLYFSSDGHGGMGGLDIYKSTWENDHWSTPVNLRAPINSGGDDFSIIVNPGGSKGKGYSGYFASNRPGSRSDDIYSFYMTPLKYTLSGTVFNLKTKETIPDATVIMMINDTSKLVATTDRSGGYHFELDADNNYRVFATKRLFFDSEEKTVSTVDLDFSEDFVRDLHLDPFMDTAIELEGIYYGLDSFNIRPASAIILDSLYNILMKHPYIVIELASHTDCRATYQYNMELSNKRAQAVVDYLVEKGIPSDRLVAKGYGESQLVNHCACEADTGAGINCTEEEHQQNRRTTFKILRTDYVYGQEQQEFIDKQIKENKKKNQKNTISNPKVTNEGDDTPQEQPAQDQQPKKE